VLPACLNVFADATQSESGYVACELYTPAGIYSLRGYKVLFTEWGADHAVIVKPHEVPTAPIHDGHLASGSVVIGAWMIRYRMADGGDKAHR
jgi:hypothetical protein